MEREAPTSGIPAHQPVSHLASMGAGRQSTLSFSLFLLSIYLSISLSLSFSLSLFRSLFLSFSFSKHVKGLPSKLPVGSVSRPDLREPFYLSIWLGRGVIWVGILVYLFLCWPGLVPNQMQLSIVVSDWGSYLGSLFFPL